MPTCIGGPGVYRAQESGTGCSCPFHQGRGDRHADGCGLIERTMPSDAGEVMALVAGLRAGHGDVKATL